DDPRMPTISGLRRRGFTPESIRNFCNMIGVARRDNLIEVEKLEFCIREQLNKIALRRMVVFDPLKIVIINEEDPVETVTVEDNPEDPSSGSREIPFSRTIYIEREDFMEDPPKKYNRLSPKQAVRLKGAYIIQCEEVIKDDTGLPVEIRCRYVPGSLSGADNSGIKPKG